MELKEKTPHTILNEIIEAAKECGQVMLQADRENFGIKDKAGKANFVTKYDCKIFLWWIRLMELPILLKIII